MQMVSGALNSLGFRVWGLGFKVWGPGFRAWGLGFGFRAWGLGFRVSGLHPNPKTPADLALPTPEFLSSRQYVQ